MKERPILFSTEMVKAILDGRKTQTRRVIKNPTNIKEFFFIDEKDDYPFYYRTSNGLWDSFKTIADLTAKRCPYGKIGDRLWVRETWTHYDIWTMGKEGYGKILYKASDELGVYKRWHPSIHMPRIASRITLEITNIRAERIQDISEEDAIAEGVYPVNPSHELWKYRVSDEITGKTAKECYEKLWIKINGADSWNRNDWVWVVEFPKLWLDGLNNK